MQIFSPIFFLFIYLNGNEEKKFAAAVVVVVVVVMEHYINENMRLPIF